MDIDFAIIGAQKAATTTVHKYLSLHSEINSHVQQECGFFLNDEEFKKGNEFLVQKYLNYSFTKKLLIKNAGFYGDLQSLKNLASHSPNCQLIMILRNPIQRAYSSYCMEHNHGWLKEKFDSIINIINEKNYDHVMYKLFIRLGLYADRLNDIYTLFEKNRVHVFFYEDLIRDQTAFFHTMLNKLNLTIPDQVELPVAENVSGKPKSALIQKAIQLIENEKGIAKSIARKVLSPQMISRLGQKIRKSNVSDSKNDPIDSKVEDFLYSYFRESVEKLESQLNLNLTHWKRT